MVTFLTDLLKTAFERTPLAKPGWKTVTGLTVLALNRVLFLLLSSRGLYGDEVFTVVDAVAFALTGVGIAHKQGEQKKAEATK